MPTHVVYVELRVYVTWDDRVAGHTARRQLSAPAFQQRLPVGLGEIIWYKTRGRSACAITSYARLMVDSPPVQ